MGKFEKGQWVRRTKGSSLGTEAGWHEAGFVGRVSRMDSDFCGDVVVFENGHRGYADNYEPWQPKVGDRVRLSEDNGYFGSKGDEGIVGRAYPDICRIDFVTGTEAGDFWQVPLICLEPITEQPAAPVVARAQPAALKIEAGKLYVLADGTKMGPAELRGEDGSERYPWSIPPVDSTVQGYFVYTNDGKYNVDGTDPHLDIVALWDEQAAPTAVANDNAAAKPKFKVGDRVRALCAWVDLEAGDIQTVKAVDEENDGVQLLIHTDGEPYCWMGFDEIELVTPADTTPTAIVALIEDGQPKPNSRPFIHYTVESATTEAERLASVHRGQEFGVYVLQSTSKQEKPVYEHEWQRLAADGRKIEAIKELRRATGLYLRGAKNAVEDWLSAA